jgi:3-methylornithyl-N6-L-lysine dehydrogenase
MTRLAAENMARIAQDLGGYDRELATKTGYSLRGLACLAAGIPEENMAARAAETRAAIVPLSCEQGVIPGFGAALRRILAHLGFAAFVTPETDAAGLAEAYAQKSDLIFLADDRRFVAVDTRGRRVIDNAEATGLGFAWGLHQMARGVAQQPVLVLGCGPVGRSAAAALTGLGAEVGVYDICAAKMEALPAVSVRCEPALADALKRHRLILDATPARGIIDSRHIRPETFISAPGVPHGLTDRALEKIGSRFMHDLLEIGVTVMAALSMRPAGK